MYVRRVLDDARPRIDVRALLEGAEAAPPVEAVDVVAASLRTAFGARGVSLLITDYAGDALVRLAAAGSAPGAREQGGESAERVPLEGTAHGQVLRAQRVDVQRHGEAVRVLAPVSHRGDAVGILELVLPRRPDARTVSDVAAAAHALAYVVVANRRHTDLFEWGQRSTPFSLAAEIQRRLLPESFTCEAGQFTLAGWLEPAATIGGDTFDYALGRDALRLSITDAVGHAVDSALLATLLVGSLRKGRRNGMDLAAQAREANADLADNSRTGQFVTGQLVRIDLVDNVGTIVNAGHPSPFLMRGGKVRQLDLAIDMPFGLHAGRDFQVQQLDLEPGDRIVFVTDGMLERNAADVDLPAAITDTADLHPREVVHSLGREVLRATGGRLRDDATVLCLDWYGGSSRSRSSGSGADQQLASD
jgi:serine phosphatase RsbU (regulator of sigma subunit)